MPAHASQLASHRATYDVELRQSSSSSSIKGIDGRTVFSLKRFCDGWQSVEEYAIVFSFEQATSNFISHYETWESLSGNAFSFSVMENSTSTGPAEYNGFANLENGSGEAFFLTVMIQHHPCRRHPVPGQPLADGAEKGSGIYPQRQYFRR